MSQFFDNLKQLLSRVGDYSFWEIGLELVVVWLVVFVVYQFVRGTRGARAILGATLLLVVPYIIFALLKAISGDEQLFARLRYLYGNSVEFAVIALLIVFQPELRRALVRLGEVGIFQSARGLRKARVIEEVLAAAAYLSKNKIGALIAIERQVGLSGLVDSGTTLDAAVSRDLLKTIFWPGSALHDMGVVVRGDRVVAAGVQFPLAEGEQFSSELGSRHRAAIGLSQEADALIIAVSEETGTISLAERGQLSRNLTVDALRTQLARGMERTELGSDNEDPNEPSK